jgi:ABC-type multidrug transport system fused ATPase/permease subunit
MPTKCYLLFVVLSAWLCRFRGLSWLAPHGQGCAARPSLRATNNFLHSASSHLHAKAKFSKFISDELLASLTKEENEPTAAAAPLHIQAGAKSKAKKQGNRHDVMQYNTEEVDSARLSLAGVSALTKEIAIADTAKEHGLDQLSPVRKEKPSSRIRFVESTQPDYVSIGLDKIELRFGNEPVLKEATLTVSSGERVGLVGPNGGGKVSGFTTCVQHQYDDLMSHSFRCSLPYSGSSAAN